MDTNFRVDNLFDIKQNDKTYLNFKIEDSKGKILLSTNFEDSDRGAEYLGLPKIEKDVELIGTVYDAFKSPSTKHKYKTTWKVNGGICKNRRHAYDYADVLKQRARLLLEKYIRQD